MIRPDWMKIKTLENNGEAAVNQGYFPFWIFLQRFFFGGTSPTRAGASAFDMVLVPCHSADTPMPTRLAGGRGRGSSRGASRGRGSSRGRGGRGGGRGAASVRGLPAADAPEGAISTSLLSRPQPGGRGRGGSARGGRGIGRPRKSSTTTAGVRRRRSTLDDGGPDAPPPPKRPSVSAILKTIAEDAEKEPRKMTRSGKKI